MSYRIVRKEHTTMNGYEYKSISGDQLRAGMVRIYGLDAVPITGVKRGQHAAGATFSDITLENGVVERCWGGFLYRVGIVPDQPLAPPGYGARVAELEW